MNINTKIKILLIAVTLIIASYSVGYTMSLQKSKQDRSSGTDVIVEIKEQRDLYKFAEEIKEEGNVAELAAMYTDASNGAPDGNDELKRIKGELNEEIKTLVTLGEELISGVDEITENEGIAYTISERRSDIENLKQRSQIETSKENCEKLNNELYNAVQKYNKEQEEKRKAEEEAKRKAEEEAKRRAEEERRRRMQTPTPTQRPQPQPTKRPQPQPTQRPQPQPTQRPQPRPTQRPQPMPDTQTDDIF